ncbi:MULTISPECIES: IS66 family transposase [unclassified Sphingobacterium]|uniref:IS66 family transposase n=1 Tax=unclassified Sphingobacterium TaxID=2609468 RepID=UPI002601347C|nr:MULTISPECIES: transposase [unclassified Sphingobacterium]
MKSTYLLNPIKVLDSDKKGAAHHWYFWFYNSAFDKTLLFDYTLSRAGHVLKLMLDSFKGYLQTDSYAAYDDNLGKKKDVTHLAGWVYVRYEFEKFLNNDQQRAKKALLMIQNLYKVERKAKEEKLSLIISKELRLEGSLPVINDMGKGLFEVLENTLPRNQIRKLWPMPMPVVMRFRHIYTMKPIHRKQSRRDAIRPIALGRKNWLFVNSHQAAGSTAMVYFS